MLNCLELDDSLSFESMDLFNDFTLSLIFDFFKIKIIIEF